MNVLNNYSQAADEVWPCALGLVEGLTSPYGKQVACLFVRNGFRGVSVDWIDLARDRDIWRAVVNTGMNRRF